MVKSHRQSLSFRISIELDAAILEFIQVRIPAIVNSQIGDRERAYRSS